jgi:DNA polymerase
VNPHPFNPSDAMADLVESLRMSGINYLPRSVSNPALPEPVQRISVECEALQADSGPTVPPARLNPQPEDGSHSAKESGYIQSESQPLRNRLPVAASGLFPLDAPDPSSVVQEETASLSPDQRRERLRRLAEEVSRCSKCAELARGRTKTVFGVGPIDAELCVVGEAPGAQEDLKGEPFVGDAGQLLDKILKAIGFDRSQVYICNILRCRPPSNRTPDAVEAGNCRPFLEATLALVKPRFLCLMGATAARYLLESSSGIGALRGRELNWRGVPVAVTYHPAYLLRYPDKKHDTWEDMKKMLARMGRAVPGA